MEQLAVDKHQAPLGRTATALLVIGIVLIVGGFALRIFGGNSADIDRMSGVGDPSGALAAVAIGTVSLVGGGLALITGIVLRIINR